MDTLLRDWNMGTLNAFPPFSMLPCTLIQARHHSAPLVIIGPLWHSQPWFPHLLELVVCFPQLLPLSEDLLQNPGGEIHHPRGKGNSSWWSGAYLGTSHAFVSLGFSSMTTGGCMGPRDTVLLQVCLGPLGWLVHGANHY